MSGSLSSEYGIGVVRITSRRRSAAPWAVHGGVGMPPLEERRDLHEVVTLPRRRTVRVAARPDRAQYVVVQIAIDVAGRKPETASNPCNVFALKRNECVSAAFVLRYYRPQRAS